MKPHLPLCLLAALISLNAHILAATPGADAIILNSGSPDPAVADSTLAGDGTQTGVISGSGTLLIESGTVRISSSVDNANTYSGYTVVNSGATLQFEAADFKDNVLKQLGTSELILSGTLKFGDGWPNPGNMTIGNNITLKNGALISSNDGHFTFSGAMNLDLQAGESATMKMAWGKNWILSGTVSGSGTLNLQTANNYEVKVFTLSNEGNTFTGTYNLDSAGVGDSISLMLTGTNAAGTATIQLSGDATKSWLVLGGINATVGGLTGAGMVRNGTVSVGSGGTFTASATANTLTVNQSNTGADTFTGTIDNNVNLTKSGEGTLELTNLGDYSGAIKIESGTLSLGVGTYSGTLSGSGDLVIKSGIVNLRLSATEADNFSGATEVNNGATLLLAGTGGAGASSITIANDITLKNGAIISSSDGHFNFSGDLNLDFQAGESATMKMAWGKNWNLEGIISGVGTLNLGTVSGDYVSGESKVFTLSNASNTFTGTYNIDSTGVDQSISLVLAQKDVAKDAVIQLSGDATKSWLVLGDTDATISGLTGGGMVRNGTVTAGGSGGFTASGTAHTLTVEQLNTGTDIFTGTIDSNVNLIKSGEGTLELTNLGDYSGTVKIESGTLALGAGTGTQSTGSLAASYEVQSDGILLVNEGSADANASTASGTVTLTGGQLQFKADLDGSSFGQKITFAANGSSISGGSSDAEHRGWVLSSGASTEADAAHIKVEADVTGSVISVGKIYFQNTSEDGAAMFEIASGTNLELSSILAGLDSNAALKVTGGGTLIYTGTDNGSNQTAVKAIVESGTLQIGNGGTAGDWKSGAIQLGATGAADGNGVTLTFNRSDAMTYSGVISGKGTINFDGGAGGIYTLQGANSFTGDVNIKHGKVVADSAAAFGVGNTVNLATGTTVDYARSQTDTTSILNAAADSSILNGANFNGKLNIQSNTSATAVTVTGGLSVAELSFANNSYLSVTGALSSGKITLSEGAHLNGGGLTMRNAGTLEIGKNAAAVFTGGIQSHTGSSITLKENGTLNVTGNAAGGTLTLEKSGTVNVTSGSLTLDKLTIRDAVSQVTVGGALTINNGGALYLDTNRKDTPIATATGALTLGGTFQLGFDVNQVTQIAEYTFKLFGANSYSNIQAQLDFVNEADRSFYYLDTSNFSTDGSVTLVHTDWGNDLVNAENIANMGGTYTPASGKVLLGSKSPTDGGGTRENPLDFNVAYSPVSNDAGVTDYRLTDGEGWLNFQSKMTGDGVGLLIQGNMAFTGNAADHGVIISNNNNDYTGTTRVQNAHVVLDSSYSVPGNTITAGLIQMLGKGDVTFMGSLAVLELRPGGDYAGPYVFDNNLTLRDGATLLQTGGSTELTGNLTLSGGLGGIIQNATANKLVLSGDINGVNSKLTLKGNAAAGAESIIELTGIKDATQRVLTTLDLQDKINFTLTGANLEAQNLVLTSGQFVVTNQSELRLGAVTGTANGKLKLDGGKLTTVGTGGLITLGDSGAPSLELAGTDNIITVGNTGGLRINNLIGESGFTLGGGNLTLGGGSDASHYQGAILVDKGTLTLAQDAYITGTITTTSPTTGSALALQINGGSTTAQRTTAGDIHLAAGTNASLTGDHITLGDVTLAGNSILGSTTRTAANDVLIDSLTIEATGSAAFGNDLHIKGNAQIGEGSLQAGNNALTDGDLTIGGGTVQLGSNARILGTTTLGGGTLLLDSGTLGILSITGTGTVTAAQSLNVTGNAAIGNGTLSSAQVTVGGASTLQNGTLQAIGDIKLGSLSITGTGIVQTDTTDLTKGLNISGDATIGNGTIRTGTLNIGGNTELQNGSLAALSDRALLQGSLTINGKDGKVSFLNSATVKGLVTINDGALTAGNNFSSGEFVLNAGKATLGDHASVGSLVVGSGGIFTAGDNASIAAGTGQHIAIGGSATFGKNTVLSVWGDTLDITAGGSVTFGQGSVIQGSLGERGLTFATGSAYAGFLNAGTNDVTFDNGSVYHLDGPVLQQYTGTTVGLTSAGTINIDNGTRFVLGENLRNYSIIVSPETMTLVKAGKGGELLVDGQQVKENGNYSHLLENADKYFEWYTFNLIGSNNALELEKIESIHFERVADTDNEITMASIANSLATGARYYDGELKELGASLALTAKGDGHKALSELAQSNASLLSGYMAQTRELRRHNHDLLAQVSLEKTGAERLSYEEYRNTIWANGTGGAYTLDGDDNAPGYKTTQWGGTLGTSRAYGEHFVGGIAFSYMHTGVTVDSHYGDAKGDSYDIDLFAKYNRDNWNITGVITGGLTSLDTTRNLRLDGYDSRTTASGDGSHLLATIQAGYQITASNDQNSILEPFVMISGGYSSIDSLSEKGAGNAGLTTDSRTQGLCTLGAGVKFTRDYIADEEDISRGRFDMRVMILQDLKEVNGDLTATYQGMGQKFSLDGASASRMGLLVGLGLSHPLSRQTALFGNVDGEFRKGETGVRANVGLKVTF